MNGLHRFVPVTVRVCSLAFFLLAGILLVGGRASAQFKVIGPPPFPPPVARQHIAELLQKVDSGNREQTAQTLTGLLSWYRDILDEELIAAWKKDTRPNLPELVETLADSRVAVAIVEFSWREQPQAAFNLGYAPMLGNLIARFPESAQPFLDDLLGPGGQRPLQLSEGEKQTVCRILLDLPEVGSWRRNALQILPRYRGAAESLLAQDLQGSDREKSFQAERWLADLRMGDPQSDAPVVLRSQSNPRSRPGVVLSPPSQVAVNNPPPGKVQTASVPSLRRELDRPPVPAPASPESTSMPVAQPYAGARSGTLQSNGAPIPQNAEYVFRNLPAVKLQLDYDSKIWDARLMAGEGQTQKLVLKNKSSGPQKQCVVHWSVIPNP
jgi:hypothetical protein